MPESLTKRFKQFMRELPMAEEIDSLPFPRGTETKKKADYFLERRKAIVELKSLEEDPEYKARSEVNKHRSREEFPLFYGRWPISAVLNHLPDSQQIYETIFQKISRSVERSLRNANEQIGSTKRIFDSGDVWGIMVVLNEEIAILNPKIISRRLGQLLVQRNPGGTYNFDHVHAVWILAENFVVQSSIADCTIPLITLYRPDDANDGSLCRVVDNLGRAWAAFNRGPLFHLAGTPLDKLEFTPRKQPDQVHNGMIPRHEAWRKDYRQKPYLRNLSDDALFKHGAKLLNTMVPHLLRGGTHAPFMVMAEFMRGWTHFLEECDRRRLDMKSLRDLIHVPKNEEEGGVTP